MKNIRSVPYGILLITGIIFTQGLAAPDGSTSAEPLLGYGSVFRDISYLPSQRTDKMDIYIPESGNKPAPCFLFIHGGGWFTGDKNQPMLLEKVCRPLLKAGIAVASINYNMTEKPRWPRNIYDCKQAVRFLKDNAVRYGIRPDCIIVGGLSAGGHLSLITALTPNDPQFEEPGNRTGTSDDSVAAGIDLCGVTDMRRVMPSHPPARWGNIIFDGSSNTVSEAEANPVFPKIWETASPIFHVTSNAVPLLLIHGDSDTTVEITQAEQLYEKLKETGSPVTFVPVKGAGHDISLCNSNVMQQMILFINAQSEK